MGHAFVGGSGRLIASSAGLAGVAFLLLLGISRSPTIALAFGVMAGYLPLALVRYRAGSARWSCASCGRRSSTTSPRRSGRECRCPRR